MENLAIALGAVFLAVVYARLRNSRDVIKDIPGPSSPSWLFGKNAAG
jgi:hypothetical protein